MLTKVRSFTFSPSCVDARDSITALALKSWGCQQGRQGAGVIAQCCVQIMRWGKQLTPSLIMVMRSSFS